MLLGLYALMPRPLHYFEESDKIVLAHQNDDELFQQTEVLPQKACFLEHVMKQLVEVHRIVGLQNLKRDAKIRFVLLHLLL